MTDKAVVVEFPADDDTIVWSGDLDDFRSRVDDFLAWTPNRTPQQVVVKDICDEILYWGNVTAEQVWNHLTGNPVTPGNEVEWQLAFAMAWNQVEARVASLF